MHGNYYLRAVVFQVIVLFFFSCASDSKKDVGTNLEIKLTIATAANMKYAMEELVAKFTADTGVNCEVIIGSSGKLTAQIIEGAPYDVFVSADMKYPKEVFEAGMSKAGPQVYGYGRLVLWSAVEGVTPALSALVDDQITHIAIANPQIAPYGKAAVEVLAGLNLYDSIQHKLVFGESIAQTNLFIMSQAAEVGFTSMSTVLSSKAENIGSWVEVDRLAYTPIKQGVVIINHENNDLTAAIQFYHFLFSYEAKKILLEYGYLTD